MVFFLSLKCKKLISNCLCEWMDKKGRYTFYRPLLRQLNFTCCKHSKSSELCIWMKRSFTLSYISIRKGDSRKRIASETRNIHVLLSSHNLCLFHSQQKQHQPKNRTIVCFECDYQCGLGTWKKHNNTPILSFGGCLKRQKQTRFI